LGHHRARDLVVRIKRIRYTESRARYAEVLDSVANDREEVVITREFVGLSSGGQRVTTASAWG
jgi:hypothetical protein